LRSWRGSRRARSTSAPAPATRRSLANAIPFFDELARVVAPGGYVVFGASSGPETPIDVPPERLRAELGRRGFGDFRDASAGRATGFLARRGDHY
jgi:hypothetical protein